MPKSALPDHLKDFDWQGTDNASWLMRQKKKIQVLLAAGPRVPSGFFKFRDIPLTVFAVNGKGPQRWENTDGSQTLGNFGSKFEFMEDLSGSGFYLSRIQPWTRWHISLQWPLFFNFHVIYRQKNVVTYPTYQSAFGITKMFTFGIGFKRDGDKVYWLTMNAGGNFE